MNKTNRKIQQDDAEYDDLHEGMIRDRRRLAPGAWSNNDIDCLLRQIDALRKLIPSSSPAKV